MAEGEEKTEQPSELRLKEARKKGQVAKSADVAALASLFFACCTAAIMVPLAAQRVSALLVKLSNPTQASVFAATSEAFDLWFLLSLPVLLAAMLGAVIGNVGQFGFLISSHPIKFDVNRINPVRGFKRLFSKDRLVELIKQLVKFSVVFLVIYGAIRESLRAIILLFRVEFYGSLSRISDVVYAVFVRVLLCFFAIAAFDWWWSRRSFLQSMRMSKYEVKKEYYQQEGDPHIKQERRRQHQETLEEAGAGVEDASVVITNPSHLAVAIKFDESVDETPRVCAKGRGAGAKLLIERATRQSIPIIRNVPLARDLQWLELNEEIPHNLYDSVAEVLLFIQELNQKNMSTNHEDS